MIRKLWLRFRIKSASTDLLGLQQQMARDKQQEQLYRYSIQEMRCELALAETGYEADASGRFVG